MARAVFVQDYKGKTWFDISGYVNPAKENSILKEYLILDYSAAFNRQCLMVWDGEEKGFYEVAKGENNPKSKNPSLTKFFCSHFPNSFV